MRAGPRIDRQSEGLGSWCEPARAAAGVAAPLLLTVALSWPLLFADATFNEDWLNHLWYLWHQSLAIRTNGLPSLYLNYSRGVFYPLYAFYGGTVYALAGALSLALGDAPLATYVLTYLLGFLAAYGGWYWMSRLFGLTPALAHAPAVVFVTSASYLMLIYGLGDWPEFLAVSAMPLMIASALSIARAECSRTWPAIALAGSCVVFFGSHLLTAIWGSTILVLLGAALLACVPRARHGITRAGAIRVCGLVLPALMVSAWFLLPTVAYESQTVIAAAYPHFRELLRSSMYTVAAGHLLTLSRAPTAGTVVTLSLPVLAIGWILLSISLSLRSRRAGTWMRVLLILVSATVLVAIVMTHAGLILALPRPYATLQFSFRLESYVLLGISGSLLAALVLTSAAGPRAQLWNWALVPIAAVSIAGALEQVGDFAHGRPRSIALGAYLKPTYEQEGLLNYVDDRLPILRGRLPRMVFPVSSTPGARISALTRLAPGQRVDTNIRSGPDLVHVSGGRIVGTDSEADDVLEIGSPGPGRRPRRSVRYREGDSAVAASISVGPSLTLPVVLGRLLSALGVLMLALELVVPFVRRRRDTRKVSEPHDKVTTI
jgi:hypothetical protein